MSEASLIAAPIEWHVIDIVNRVTSDFQGRVDDKGAIIRWRPDVITDFRNKRVPTAAVRLIRWDRHSPEVVFRHGFTPLADGRKGGCDLRWFVLNGGESIFVSATSCFRDANGGRVTRWKPNSCASLYEYEIFAYGGIDVDRSMVKLHPSLRKGDVVFPMGIRSEFVRSALEYDKSGTPIRFWTNGLFDIDANGIAFRPKVDDYPGYIYPSSVVAVAWTGKNKTYNRIVAPDGAKLTGDIMSNLEGEQQPIDVEYFQDQPVARAAMPVPNARNEVYFFCHTRAVRFDIEQGLLSNQGQCAAVISRTWKALSELGIATVDVVLPHYEAVDTAYAFVFSDTRFAVVNIADDVKKDICTYQITSKFGSLATAGFDSVDAALRIPHPTQAYACFFKRTQYVIVDYKHDKIIEGPGNIANRWPVLGDAGFMTIDAILQHPQNAAYLYVFSGTDYALITVTGDRFVDGPRPIAGNWKVLTGVGFY